MVRVGIRAHPPLEIMIDLEDFDPLAAWQIVQFRQTYYPSPRSEYPVRGGVYHAGEVAGFPPPEAQALIAAGVAVPGS